MRDDIALFVPVRNEEESLGSVLSTLPTEDNHGRKIIPIVVDDGSTDSSVAVARRFTRHVVALTHAHGVGYATRTGLMYITDHVPCEYVIKLDGDGQHKPGFIPRVIEALDRGADVVVCSRFHPEADKSCAPPDRLLLNRVCTEMIRSITRWNLTDARSGFMGFPISLVRYIAPRIITDGYGIPMEILLRAWGMRAYANVYEIPHPAMYLGFDISQKLVNKYMLEDLDTQSERMRVAFGVILRVMANMQIPKEKLFHRYPLPMTHGEVAATQRLHAAAGS